MLGMQMRGGIVRTALVVSPLSLVINWMKEAQKFLRMIVPNVQIHKVSSDMYEANRQEVLMSTYRRYCTNC